MMRKIYQIPSVNITAVHTIQMLAASPLGKYNEGADADVVLVKGDRSGQEDGSEYYDWDYDWSKFD